MRSDDFPEACANADLIANAPTDLADLLAAHEALALALQELLVALDDSDRREQAGDPLAFHSNMLRATRNQAKRLTA